MSGSTKIQKRILNHPTLVIYLQPLSGEIGKKFSMLKNEEIELLKKRINYKKFPIFGSLKHPSDSLKEKFFVKIPHTSKTTIATFWSLGNYMYKDSIKKFVEKYVINRLN